MWGMLVCAGAGDGRGQNVACIQDHHDHKGNRDQELNQFDLWLKISCCFDKEPRSRY